MNPTPSHPAGAGNPPLTAPPASDGAFGPYLRAIRARLAIVVLITAAAVAASVALVAGRSREFQATTQVLVSPLSEGDNTTLLGVQFVRNSGDPPRTVQTAATLIDSTVAAQRTASTIGSGYDAEKIHENVTVKSVGESNVVGVTAKADDPRLAARIADTFVRESLADRGAQLRAQLKVVIAGLANSETPADLRQAADLRRIAASGDPTLTVLHPAQIPVDPTGAPGWLIVALALVAGFTLASVAALLMERLDHRVRDVAELLQIAPYPVLARVPSLPRRPKPSDDAADISPGMREAFRTLQIQLDRRAAGTSRSVVVTSPSSGDGKTTTAINLAFALVAAGHQVILMDFDLRNPAIEDRLGMPASPGLVSLLTSPDTLDELLQPAPLLAPLRVVSAAKAPGDVSLLQVLARRLDDILAQASLLADYVVIDTPPVGEVGDALMVAAHADELIIVGRAGNTDRAGMELSTELLEQAGIAPIGWVLAGDDSGTRAGGYPVRAARRPLSPA